MMNLFDLSTTMAGKKNAFGDVSIGGKNRFVVGANKATDAFESHTEDKPVTFESRKGFSGKKSSVKPMKTFIAQEMSKEIDSSRKSPNVVARLMGLDDTLSGDSSIPCAKRTLQDGGSTQIHADESFQSYCNGTKDYRDAYEVRHRQSRSNSFNEQVLQRVQQDANRNEKRMALVREKFVEAKRLATDEKLLDSKEFHDALEVLSCNRDLFLKFLEEPNSLFSSHLEAPHSIPSQPQTNRITVLKPSKTKEAKSMAKQNQYNTASLCSSLGQRPRTQILSQPTRIVVLKPNPKKHFDMKSPETPSSPGPPERGELYGGLHTQGSMDSREAVMDIKPQMRESQNGHRRDESLLSSVFSNGYVGDDSSFNRSDNYVGGDECNNTDSEISTSWDYTSNRYGSPCSHSSLSRASYSPESSVIREAKKRLSERWALVTSNGQYHEKFQGRRSSSTLGEMLSINELKMKKMKDMEPKVSGTRSCDWEDEVEMPATCLSISRMKDVNVNESSSSNLSRSKSVPNTSLTYGSMDSSTEDLNSRLEKSVVLKETAKCSSGKTSFKGRVSSLFFSKNKKSGRDESVSSPFVNDTDVFQIGSDEIVVHKHDGSSEAIPIHVPEASPSRDFEAEPDLLITSPVALEISPVESTPSPQVSLHQEDPGPSSTEDHEILRMSEKLNENQDHPSPTSTLDAPFKDDAIENTPISSKFPTCENPQALSRSPPIESIARTLSWDDSCSKAPSAAPLKFSRAFCEDDPEDLLLVQNLLTSSGLCKNSLSTIFNGWHLPDIPLDPKLLDKLPDVNDKVPTNRERRAKQKLIFDFVNAVLREFARSAEQGAYHRVPGDEPLLSGQVWLVVKKKLFEAENSGPVVDRLLGKEVSGSVWTELMRAQIAEISKEIGVQVLEDLVGEVFVELNVS